MCLFDHDIILTNLINTCPTIILNETNDIVDIRIDIAKLYVALRFVWQVLKRV